MSQASNTVPLSFIINDEIIELSLPLEESDLVFKLTNDDAYTVTYIKDLISTGCISISGELQTIFRTENGEQGVQLYSNILEDNSDINSNTNSLWTDDETRLLLNEYEASVTRVGPMKRFKTKKLMWNSIAEYINTMYKTNRTGVQVENRYKTIMKRKKVAVEHNHVSGAGRAEIPFEEELSKIAALDDSIQPEVVRSSSNVRLLKVSKEATPSTSTQNREKKHKIKSVQEVLVELHQQKEEARERRHQEKMTLIKELFGKENSNQT